MKTASPTRTASESASGDTTASRGTTETWRREMSARGSEAITLPRTGFLAGELTADLPNGVETWAGVRIFPVPRDRHAGANLAELTGAPSVTSSPRVRITTTDGLTRR